MARRITFTIARFGWAVAEDLKALFYVLIGVAVAGAPLGLWRSTTQGVLRDIVRELPVALVLASFALAGAASGWVLYRLYRFVLRCRAC